MHHKIIIYLRGGKNGSYRLGRKVGGVGGGVDDGDEGGLGARKGGPIQAAEPGVQLHLPGPPAQNRLPYVRSAKNNPFRLT